MIAIKKARDSIKNNINQIKRFEAVPLQKAAGRVAYENVCSAQNIPGYDNSAMDGIALKFSDLSKSPLKIINTVYAGDNKKIKYEKGACVKIMTGAPLPECFDTVVKIEDCKIKGKAVYISSPRKQKRGQFIRKYNENIKKGEVLLKKGEVITIKKTGVLALCGITKIKVYGKINVLVASTGNEIISYKSKLKKGFVRDSNSLVLTGILKQNPNLTVKFYGIARDNHEDTKKLIAASKNYDLTVTTGSVSAGEYDLIPGALKKNGFKIIYHKVNMKPGKPNLFAATKKTAFFGMPGNTVACYVGLNLFVNYAINIFYGINKTTYVFYKGILTENYFKNDARPEFVRVKVVYKNGKFYLTPFKNQGSGIFKSIADTDALMFLKQGVKEHKKNSEEDFFFLK